MQALSALVSVEFDADATLEQRRTFAAALAKAQYHQDPDFTSVWLAVWPDVTEEAAFAVVRNEVRNAAVAARLARFRLIVQFGLRRPRKYCTA
jgi:hypothetical protein